MLLYGSSSFLSFISRSVTYYYPNQVYPLYPWEIATTCSLSTTQFADAQPSSSSLSFFID